MLQSTALTSGKKTAVPALLLKAAGTAVFIIHVCERETMAASILVFTQKNGCVRM